MPEKTNDSTPQHRSIRSFRDLDVYNLSYQASIDLCLKILPTLPKEEKFDLVDQLRRSCKAIPRLIAEGYAKRHQLKGFQKYLDDVMAECNETWVGLSQAKDLYSPIVDIAECQRLIGIYDRLGRQLYRLRESWHSFPAS